MKCKYEAKPQYEEVEIFGKTYRSETGTIDRKKIGRALLTEEAGFSGGHQIVNGDGVAIRTVQPVEEIELFVEMVGGDRSLASFKFYNAHTARNPENENVLDVFVDDAGKVDRLVSVAGRMSDAKPECDGQWKIVTADGRRAFVRLVKPVGSNGMIAEY